jgi:homoserine kinase
MTISAFAPATVANLGPGFDVLGLALDGLGDTVKVSKTSTPGVQITAIHGDGGALPMDPSKNTAAIAAAETLKAAGVEVGLRLELYKGLSLCSGLGSSAASAAAAAFATNQLIGSPLRKLDLIGPCIEAEAVVSGRHADNVAPALLGGLVLIRSANPVDVVRLPIPEGLMVVVITPDMALPTKHARSVLPGQVPLATMVAATAQIASLVSACYSSDLSLLSRSLEDPVVTPARIGLIPGGQAALDVALGTGALGASISGAGPSLFALCRSERSARMTAIAMSTAIEAAGQSAAIHISPANCPGARLIRTVQA